MKQKVVNNCVTLTLLLLLAACSTLPESGPVEHDILITGGLVYTNYDEPMRIADVALRGKKISFIGDARARGVTAKTTFDARNKIVAPGFIDPHTHSLTDLLKPESSLNSNYLMQGVTTVLTGNDGYGPVDTAGTIMALANRNIGTNVGLFVGHGSIRKQVMGLENRAPTAIEQQQMNQLLRNGIKAGAFGLSTGLYYVPGSYAETDEVVELTRVLKETGGVYDSHIRDESSYNVGLEAAVSEVIEIGERTGVPVHIAHIKALGVDVWNLSETLTSRINAARNRGVKVTADQYPWLASGTRIGNALVPNWAKEGSTEKLNNRLRNPKLQQRIDLQMQENLRKRGGASAILITDKNSPYRGLTLAQAAAKQALGPIAMARKIVLAGDTRIASFNMQASDVEHFMLQPWVMTSSDGSAGHPRKYGSFPRKYRIYVKERAIMNVKTFIHQSAELTGKTFGLCNRGTISAGNFADIVVFDPEKFSEQASFEEPEKLSLGVDYLFINGEMAVGEGVAIPVGSGQTLRAKDCE